ncbi:MAG: PAS domain S-box protein [Bdellovibrionota bacterium]
MQHVDIGLTDFLQSLPLAVLFVNTEGNIQGANPATYKIFGYERDDLNGKSVEMLVPESFRGGHEQHRKNYMNQPSVRPMGIGRDLLGRRRDGSEFPIEVSLHPVVVNGKTAMVAAIVTDISERKRVESERRSFDAQVQEQQKFESLGLMAGGVAHDFNNLLAIILGNAGLAVRKLQNEPAIQLYLERVQQAAERASELANQLLAYSGKGRFVVGPVNFSQLAHQMASLLEASISKKGTLHFNLNEIVPPVEADITQIRQVLLNLVINASEALGGERGLITVSTGSHFVDQAFLSNGQVPDLAQGTYVFLEVSDTGCGMDRETQERVFEPFFTTKATGRGLGLAAVMGIARGHRGFIKVYSEAGQGTSIKVYFPASAAYQTENPQPATAALVGSKRQTILVVDDEPLLVHFAKEVLEEAGYSVLTAHDGREALSVFRNKAPDIHCVLLDMMMGDMNGDEVFRTLRSIRADIKVVLTSGYDEQEMTAQFVGRGLAGFVRKPYGAPVLLAKIAKALEG